MRLVNKCQSKKYMKHAGVAIGTSFLLDTAVTREAKTLLQTWIDAKFASDCLMGFRFAFTCCFVKTFLMERAPFISTRGALEPSTLILGNPV
jgi:hypothetical protein